ncbi:MULTISPECIES: hypothetical protein [Bacteria]|uniref:hypothetical protein n=1 Tax=Bacteria TaxID=2 RepID=UPI00242F2661|nr:hypothetical protein [Holdemanella biformis]MBS6455022.1 hypothetical protein [Holdemanella biformis]
MDSNDFKELQIDRSKELKDKFLSSLKVLSSDYEKREYELMNVEFAEEILNKFTLSEIEKAIFADVELEKKNKQNENGFLIALYALRSANGDKIKAVSFLKKLKDTAIAYYDYKINVEKIRTKALSELCNDLINF